MLPRLIKGPSMIQTLGYGRDVYISRTYSSSPFILLHTTTRARNLHETCSCLCDCTAHVSCGMGSASSLASCYDAFDRGKYCWAGHPSGVNPSPFLPSPSHLLRPRGALLLAVSHDRQVTSRQGFFGRDVLLYEDSDGRHGPLELHSAANMYIVLRVQLSHL